MAYARFIRHPSSCQGAWQTSVFQPLQSSSCLVLASRKMPPSKALIRIDRYDQGCVSRSPICHAQSSPKSGIRYVRHSDHGAGHRWDYCSVQSREQVLLHPLGVSEPKRILVVRTKYNKLNLDLELGSVRAFADARANKQVFEYAGAARPISCNFADRAVPVRLPGAAVSAEWFDVFGARPALGRVFTADEDQPNANRVVVLAHDAWLRLFGGDQGVVGRTIGLNQQPYEIIGVMGRGFHQPHAVDLWVPLALPPSAFASPNVFDGSVSFMIRMQLAVSFAQAEAWLRWNAERLAAAAPANLRGLVMNWGWSVGGSRFTSETGVNNK